MTRKPLNKNATHQAGVVLAADAPETDAEAAAGAAPHGCSPPACEACKQDQALRRALGTMKESRDHYLELYDFAPVGYLTVGLSGLIEEANLTCAALLGTERSELIHSNFENFVAEFDRNRWRQLFPLELQESKHHCCELTLQGKDGKVFHARLDCGGMSGTDGLRQLRFVLTDITAWKNSARETHERRKEMDELQKLHVAAQTASAIAHELNQPLLAIASYSRAALLMLKSGKPDVGEICCALEGNERQVQRAEQSIREMFDFLSSNEFPVETFDLVQEIILILEDARKEHELIFQSSLRLEEKLPPVRANRTHVQKALFNLLRNGIEAATRASGAPLPVITVTMRKAGEDNAAQVTVQDNGPGFSEEGARRVFEPFFTTKEGGFGMGLTISRSLIEMNGGELWLAERCGPGAAFNLTIPLAA